MWRVFPLLALLGLLLAPMAGCGPAQSASAAKAEELKSSKPRLAAPEAGDARLAELVAGNSVFALDLYRALFNPQKNAFYSPYSISLALAMTYAGAKGETESEMAHALRFTLAQAQLHPAFNALDQALASRGEQSKARGERFRLHVANALWGQKDYAFQAAFLDALAQNYGAGLRALDFKTAPEPARQTINRWVEEQTEQKIKDLLPPNSIDAAVRLVLTNAIYFNAGWQNPFNDKATRDGAFQLLDGSTVTVPLMSQGESLGYAEGAGYQAVELPYVGNELSMVVLLPARGNFEGYARALDAEQLTATLRALKPAQVQLTLPRFKYEAELPLKDVLVDLGMVQAFDPNKADLSGMTGRRDLYIDEVYHKAFVAVDEKGTEAAAATAVVARLTAAPAQPKEMRVDRPFIFLIRDMQTGALLFVGHVVNPAK